MEKNTSNTSVPYLSSINEVYNFNSDAKKLKNTLNTLNKGIINYSCSDFSYNEYTFTLSTDTKFILNHKNEIGLYLLFCCEGNFTIFLNKESIGSIEELQSTIIYNSEMQDIVLELNKNQKYHFGVIRIDNQVDKYNSVFTKSKDAFSKINPFNIQNIPSIPCLKLIDKFDLLSSRIKKDTSSELVIEGLILQIIGIKLEHLKDIEVHKDTLKSVLTLKELNRIKACAKEIKEYPSFEYTISYLCNKTSLSPFKLQEGFKQLYNVTANDYVRDMRLEKAINLFKTTDLNISQVVYSIGLTSRSYFSKIFKNKFKCSPRVFRKKK